MESDYRSSLRKMPSAEDAERQVLGALLIDPDALDTIGDLLVAEDFHDKRHRALYRCIVEMAEARQPIDVVTVCAWMSDRGEVESIGGMQYPASLANEAISSAGISAYAQIVRGKAVLRELIRASSDTMEMAYQPGDRDVQSILDAAQSRILALEQQHATGKSSFVSVKEATRELVEHLESASKNHQDVIGLPTGYEDLDSKTAGLHPGQLVIIAGRPSMGKTAFAMNIAENVACDQKKTVAVFSMEMPVRELMIRLLSSRSRVSQHRIRTGRISSGDVWARLAAGLGDLRQSAIYIDDSPALSPMDLRARARRLKKEVGNLDLIVVDYLQLMRVPSMGGNRVAEISEISQSLKALAKELAIPVIALSQLNRGLENRNDKRPILSDLRESGAIEQDADLILFLYREEVYRKDDEEVKGIAEVIIGKQRNGPTDTVRMTFSGEFSRFENYAPQSAFGDNPY